MTWREMIEGDKVRGVGLGWSESKLVRNLRSLEKKGEIKRVAAPGEQDNPMRGCTYEINIDWEPDMVLSIPKRFQQQQ